MCLLQSQRTWNWILSVPVHLCFLQPCLPWRDQLLHKSLSARISLFSFGAQLHWHFLLLLISNQFNRFSVFLSFCSVWSVIQIYSGNTWGVVRLPQEWCWFVLCTVTAIYVHNSHTQINKDYTWLHLYAKSWSSIEAWFKICTLVGCTSMYQ